MARQFGQLKIDLAFDRSIAAEDDPTVLSVLLEELSTAAPEWSSGVSIRYPSRKKGASWPAGSDELIAHIEEETRPREPYSGGNVDLRGLDKNLVVTATVSNAPLSRTGGKLLLRNNVSVTYSGGAKSLPSRLRWSGELFRSLVQRTDPAWGGLYSNEEYFSQVMEVDPSIRAVGRDFGRALPGVFMQNFFGRRYVSLIGADRFDELLEENSIEVEEVGHGILVAMRDLDLVAGLRSKIRQTLGEEFFFDKESPEGNFRAPDWTE